MAVGCDYTRIAGRSKSHPESGDKVNVEVDILAEIIDIRHVDHRIVLIAPHAAVFPARSANTPESTTGHCGFRVVRR